MQNRQSITQSITWFAGIVIIVIVIAFPLGYFFISYQYTAGILETEAEINAKFITQIISANPEMWEFQQLRIQENLSRRPGKGFPEIRRVLNTKNELVAENVEVLKKPLIMHSDELMDSGVVVGRIEIYRSLRPLLIRTGLAALLLLPIGSGTFLILRNLPIRTIYRAEEALRRSEESTKQIAQENAIMAEIGRIVSSSLNINEVYERFAEEVLKLIPFDRIVINTINIEMDTVINAYIAGKGIVDRKVGEIYPLEGSGNAEMARTKSSLLVQTEDFNEYKDSFPMLLSTFQAGFRSIMNVPLFSKGRIIGGLLLRSFKPYAYTDKDVRLAERIGDQIAGAIANAQLFAERKQTDEALHKSQEELIKRHRELNNLNKETNENRKKLQFALDEVSSLIHQVVSKKSFGIKFNNPNLKKCYEITSCSKKDCPCYGKEATRCWQQVGTFCAGKVQGSFTNKYDNCANCPVFLQATSDPIYLIGEQFNNMMYILESINKELEKAYKELKTTQTKILQQEKMASIGQLAAGVAHEINNPMAFISSNLGTLDKYANRLTEFIQIQSEVIESLHMTDAIEGFKRKRESLKIDYITKDIKGLIAESLDGSDRVRKIVQGLKTFARVNEAEYKYVEINRCIESTINIIWNELKYKAILKKDYGNIPLTKCFPQQMNQVFMNILVNAAHAIEKQGEIAIKTWHEDGAILIGISDTGRGIPKENLNKIFEPFFTTKEVGEGTGLGLSITYEIVKKHNGEITVESEVGKGTTFTVRIPIVTEA